MRPVKSIAAMHAIGIIFTKHSDDFGMLSFRRDIKNVSSGPIHRHSEDGCQFSLSGIGGGRCRSVHTRQRD